MKTHALILDTMKGSFSLVQDSESKVLKAFKIWDSKIQKSKWITIPSDDDLPSKFQTNLLIGLRVVKIPENIRTRLDKINDPKINAFLEKANNFGSNFGEETQGVDLLDRGFRQ